MYSTCLFCRAALGANEAIEAFPVGKRLAFDAAKGRLWAICPACARWNLTPIDERWEAIEECERRFRGTRVRVTTGNIGLAKLRDGTELVRIGAPLRPEFAAWRYGARLGFRWRRAQLVAGGGIAASMVASMALGPALAPALTLGAVSILAVPGLTTVMGVVPVLGVLAARDYLRYERVVALVPHEERALVVRAKHVKYAELAVGGPGADGGSGETTLDVQHDGGWARLTGTRAMQTATVLLASSNRLGAGRSAVRDAVSRIEQVGDAATYLASASHLGRVRHRLTSLVNDYRRLGALHLAPTERLALEMAMHEEAERRLLDGELELLATAWREAETIAEIADSL